MSEIVTIKAVDEHGDVQMLRVRQETIEVSEAGIAWVDSTGESNGPTREYTSFEVADQRAVYRIPKRFADDHWNRDLGPTDVLIEEKSDCYVVEMERDGWADMLSDAEYYWDMRSEMIQVERAMLGLCSSARATAEALRRQGPPVADGEAL